MRVALNLASRRFVELGPLYARLRLIIAVLAVLALPLWVVLHSEERKASQAHARVATAESNIQNLRREQQGFQAEMRQPQNAAVLSQAQFLNTLYARKAFSWTAVMMDLENVLPAGVQVLNIDPVVAKDGSVTIRLRVSGARDRAVELVRNLEHSRRFLFPRLAGESADTSNATAGNRGFQPVANVNGVNFDILAEYNPLQPKAATAEPETAPGRTARTRRHAAPKAGGQ